jgi:hypothetical protein
MQGFEPKRPPFWLSFFVCAVLVAVLTYLRLATDRNIGPTLGLALLACLWNRERFLLWGMALIFTGVVFIRLFWMPPHEVASTAATVSRDWYRWELLSSMLVNIWVIAAVVHLFIGLHERLERRNATLEVANAYLESANKELVARAKQISQQHDEIVAKEKQIEVMTRELAERKG